MSVKHDLPELRTAILGDADVEHLLEDIERLAELDAVLFKGGDGAHATKATPCLSKVREALREGQVRGVQLRYHIDGEGFWDTLVRVPEGVRLVRCAAPRSRAEG